MSDIRQSILALDNSLKILSTIYESTTSIELKTLNEQINHFEKRWSKLIDDLEQCSIRVNNFIRTISNDMNFCFISVKKSKFKFWTKCTNECQTY